MIYLKSRIILLLEEVNNSLFKNSSRPEKRRLYNGGPASLRDRNW